MKVEEKSVIKELEDPILKCTPSLQQSYSQAGIEKAQAFIEKNKSPDFPGADFLHNTLSHPTLDADTQRIEAERVIYSQD